MKSVLKILGVLLLLLVLLMVGGVLARDQIAIWAVKKVVTQKTGFGLELKSLHIALAPPGLEVQGLKLTNPPDFPEAGALEISKLTVSYDQIHSTKAEARLPEVTLDLQSVVVVRKADGEVNFKRFAKQSQGEAPAGGDAPAPQPPPQPAPTPTPAPEQKQEKKFRIDHLNIRIGTVLVHTYVQGELAPREQKFVMNVDRKFENVTNADLKNIGTQLFLEILFKSSPDALINLGGGALNLGKDAGANTGEMLKNSGQQIQQQFKNLLNSLKQQPQQ